MEERPRLVPQLTSVDKLTEGLCLGLLGVLWVASVAGLFLLPDTIPTHFNFKGQADDFGSNKHILTLPAVATLLYAAMTMLNRYPHLFNYPGTISMDNALGMYTTATRTIRVLKLVVVLVFSIIVAAVYASAGTH